MKKKILAGFMSTIMLVSSICIVPIFAEDDGELTAQATSIAAFPGAEGGGMFATGGRGGKVVYVTNLNDSGTGSFREAVSGSNRIVVFKVGGTIELKSDVVIKGNVTVAGQTAPGGNGITVKNYKIGLGGSNIILRYVNSRPGERGTNADYDALGGSDGSNSIVDHCSFSWANDEQWGLYSNNDNATTQWSVIGPSNSFSYHSKGVHGFGVMFGRSNHTMHHNMIVHNVSRNFRGKVVGTNTVDFVNNVIYNWGYQTAYGTLGHLNYVGNYLKMGPSTKGGYRYVSVGDSGTEPENYSIYLTGNKFVNTDDTDYSTLSSNNWTGITYGSSSGKTEANTKSTSAFAMKVNSINVSVATTAESADDAYKHVLEYAGAGIDATSRSAIDQQVMEEARTGTGSLTGARPYAEANATQKDTIDTYNIACGVTYQYPTANTNAVIDSDEDGMPDEWEVERGLNPYSKYSEAGTLEANGDYCGQGYTNIEYYINDLTINSFPEGTVTISPTVGTTVTVDATADEVDGTNPSRKTIAGALAYIKNDGSSIGTKTIVINAGEYNEDISTGIDNLLIESAGGANAVINGSVSSSGETFTLKNINVNGKVSISGDKSIIEGSTVTNSAGEAVEVKNGARFYINNTTLTGSGDVLIATGRGVAENSVLEASNAVVSNIGQSDSYGVLLKDCEIKCSTIAKVDSAFAQVVTYNCSADSVGTLENRYLNMDESKKANVRFVECNTVVDLSAVCPSYASVVSEGVLLEEYNPFNHTRGTDGWNPGSWSEVTPQEALKALAESITLPSSIIKKDTAVVTAFDSDTAVNVRWETTDSTAFSNNTIKIGAYGEGVKSITLTVTLSKAGLKDEVRTFNILVGSEGYAQDDVITFDDIAINTSPEYFKNSASDTTGIEGYVTDNIDGTTFVERGNFYKINQTTTTGDVIHNFSYNFGEKPNSVFEVGYDVYIDEIAADGYFESYVRGTNALGQIRYTNSDGATAIEAYKNSTTRTELATSNSGEWYKFKIIVNTVGVENGTEPVINYYLYDSEGNLKASVKGSAPAKDYASATDYTTFIPNRIEFRPNRNFAKCEFYVDNIYIQDYTDIAVADAKALSTGNVELSGGEGLASYGEHMSSVTWRVVDGATELVNSDGSINYDKCQAATVKVRGTVSYGTDLKASADTDTITLKITGTGSTNPVVAEKDFSDTDDFSGWIAQYSQAAAVNTADTASVNGNASTKIRLDNKAVFRPLEGVVASGKANIDIDFLSVADVTNTTGRTFRIYFENAETGNSNGVATAEFDNTNIFYHLMDLGNVPRVVTADLPTANTEVGTAMDTSLESNKWYHATIEIDMDNQTATTSIYRHGANGEYAPDSIGTEPLAVATTAFVSKSPLQLEQIRLVRTAAAVVYFDNITLKCEADSGEEPVVPDETIYGDTDGDGILTSSDSAYVLQYSLNASSLTVGSDWLKKADVDGDGIITAGDAAEILQKVLNGEFVFSKDR